VLRFPFLLTGVEFIATSQIELFEVLRIHTTRTAGPVT